MISERKIKQLAARKKLLISDKNFFTSSTLKTYFEELAVMLTRRYGFKLGIRVKLLWGGKNDPVAYTDNNTIVINTNNDMVRKYKSREDKLDIIKGLFAHELGHVLFTDFNILESFYDAVSVAKWYPEKPKFKDAQNTENLIEIDNYLRADKNNSRRFFSVAKHIDNIIEDGFIENAFMEKYKGNLAEGLYLLRETQFNSIQKVWELAERTQLDENDENYLHPFQAETQILLCYAKYGEFRIDDRDELEEDIVQDLLPALEYVDGALLSQPLFRRKHVNEVLVVMWPQIKSYLDWIASRPETASEESGDSSETGSSAVSKSLGESTKGTSTVGSGSSKHKDKGEAPSGKEGKAKRDKSKAEASGETPVDDGIKNGKGTGYDSEAETSEEGGRIKEHETSSISTASDFDTDDDSEWNYDPTNETGGSDIESLLEKMATEEAEEELEKERLKELQNEATGLNYGEAHKGMRVDVHRITHVPESLKEQYASTKDLMKISKRLQKLIAQQLKDKRAGGKQTNLYIGRRLDARTLIRDDGKCFYKRNLPQEAPTISVCVLIDESGSMSWDHRATYARATAVVLYDFCMGLGIPCAIYGHSADMSSYGSLQIFSYAEFDSIDKNDKYRLMDIQARSNNRDGAALKYVYSKMEKREEEVKLVIVISDGQPAASGYSGSEAERDMRSLKNTYSRKGITTFAAAIGSDKDNIHRIYGDGFLDISDLNKLPEILTKLILKYIKI